jgi:hypothetical protein
MCREENAQAARAFRGSAMPACRDAQRSAAMRENFSRCKKVFVEQQFVEQKFVEQ